MCGRRTRCDFVGGSGNQPPAAPAQAGRLPELANYLHKWVGGMIGSLLLAHPLQRRRRHREDSASPWTPSRSTSPPRPPDLGEDSRDQTQRQPGTPLPVRPRPRQNMACFRLPVWESGNKALATMYQILLLCIRQAILTSRHPAVRNRQGTAAPKICWRCAIGVHATGHWYRVCGDSRPGRSAPAGPAAARRARRQVRLPPVPAAGHLQALMADLLHPVRSGISQANGGRALLTAVETYAAEITVLLDENLVDVLPVARLSSQPYTVRRSSGTPRPGNPGVGPASAGCR